MGDVLDFKKHEKEAHGEEGPLHITFCFLPNERFNCYAEGDPKELSRRFKWAIKFFNKNKDAIRCAAKYHPDGKCRHRFGSIINP